MSARSAIPSAAAAMPTRGRAQHDLLRLFDDLRLLTNRFLTEQSRNHRLDDPGGTLAQDVVGGSQAILSGFGSVCSSAGVTQDQRRQLIPVSADEFKGNVASHRKPTERHRLSDVQRVEHGGEVVGILCHRHLAFRDVTLTESTQIGNNDSVRRRKLVDLRSPHRVIQRKAVHEEQWAAFALHMHAEVDSVDVDGLHAGRFECQGVRVKG